MTSLDPIAPAAPAVAVPAEGDIEAAPCTTAASAMEARLSHLFRPSLKTGRIHPLYLPVLRYRLTRVGE